MRHPIVSYARKRFEEGATVEQVAEEVRLHREFKSGPNVVSALYCPDGRRYEWAAADARGAELLARVLGEEARKVGGEWVDVKMGEG